MTLASDILALSPSGFWKLDEPSGVTANDSSGNAISLTYTNSPGLGAASIIPSTTDTCVDYDGVNDTTIGPTGGTLAGTNTKSLIAFGSIDALSTTINVQQVIMGKPVSWSLLIYNISGGNTNRLLLNSGGTNLIGTTNLQINTFYMFGAMFTGGGSALREVYLNGVRENFQTAGPAIVSNANAFRIGDGGGNFYNGKLQYAAFWNGVALTSSNFAALWATANVTNYLRSFTTSISLSGVNAKGVGKPETTALSLAATRGGVVFGKPRSTPLTLTGAASRLILPNTKTTALSLTASDVKNVAPIAKTTALSLTGVSGARTVGVNRTTALTLTGVIAKRITAFRAFTTALSLTATNTRALTWTKAFTTSLTLTGVMSRTVAAGRTFTTPLTLTATRGNHQVGVSRSAPLNLTATITKRVVAFRSFTTALTLTGIGAAATGRARSFTTALVLTGKARIDMSQAVLNRLTGGGVTVVKKLFFIADD